MRVKDYERSIDGKLDVKQKKEARKILRMCWGMMKSGEFYTPKTAE